MTRGEIFRLASPRGARGREQKGARFCVLVQADELLPFNTVVVAPTSTSAPAATFRPAITISGVATRVMVDQVSAIDLTRLGSSAGRLDAGELRAVDEALAVVLGL
ncbi:MAG TPA: type II toxin-antitoxin system PemK/MazF family toxin [Solirubrobacteraceae bacterium]|nr:type II toxin-antitoxin system PemK/MazF family toxin [Solirubrobacteraceae bacterium]